MTYLGFGTQAGHYGQGGGLPPTGYIEAGEIEMDPDGRFELILSTEPRAGNWLPMTAESGTLIVRQTFPDRHTEIPADLHIERIDCTEEERSPTPLTPAQIEQGLRSVSTLVAGASLLFAKWARDFQKHRNTLPRFDQEVSNAAGGDPNIACYHSHWALDADEVLLIEALPPACEHWNFQLNNHWMESLDYRYHTIHTNKHLATCEANGSIRLIVAHQDPGLPNWIETAGYTSGTMCFRWVRADTHPLRSHGDVRALSAWEGFHPLPLPGEGPDDIRGRQRRARMTERGIAYLAPAFFAVHPAEHDAPEEDVLLLDVCFMSQSAEATTRTHLCALAGGAGPHADLRVLPHAAADPPVAATRQTLGAQDAASPGVPRYPPQGLPGSDGRADAPRSPEIGGLVLQHGGARQGHLQRPRTHAGDRRTLGPEGKTPRRARHGRARERRRRPFPGCVLP